MGREGVAAWTRGLPRGQGGCRVDKGVAAWTRGLPRGQGGGGGGVPRPASLGDLGRVVCFQEVHHARDVPHAVPVARPDGAGNAVDHDQEVELPVLGVPVHLVSPFLHAEAGHGLLVDAEEVVDLDEERRAVHLEDRVTEVGAKDMSALVHPKVVERSSPGEPGIGLLEELAREGLLGVAV